MFARQAGIAAAMVSVLAVAGYAQLPKDFKPLVFEAEEFSGPQDAWNRNKVTENRWNLWSTDTDARQKWSGGVVLQSPVVKADRDTPENGAPPLHTRITGIPAGRYEVDVRIGRTLAVSLDGKTWQKKSDGDRTLGVFQIKDGTFDLWVDDRYAHAANPGAGYFDFVQFTPVPERIDKPLVAGFAQTRVRETLDRALTAIRTGENAAFLSWRLLAADPPEIAFDVYRRVDGGKPERVNSEPLRDSTCLTDRDAPRSAACEYVLRVVGRPEADKPEGVAKISAAATPDAPAIVFELDDKATVQKVGVGDLDGDGRFDFVLKTPEDNIDPAGNYWKPSPDTYRLDAFSHDGRRLWRHDLGWSIERGIWYSPMIVFDLNGDGRAELAAKTGEGDPRGADGRVESGAEWVTVFDGLTGKPLARDEWPSRQTPGEPYNYNYASRNQICVAYLDGKTPCLIVERGTYTTIRLVAYQFHDGKLHRLWTWDSREETGRGKYRSQGAHIMKAADVDGDGRDEVIIGSSVIDDNGNGLWTTGYGHPDYCFVGEIDPQRRGLEIFYGIEPARAEHALCLVDAATGKVIWGLQEATNHVGTDGMCADIDARYPGSECHAADIDADRKFSKSWTFSAQGQLITDAPPRNLASPVHWDDDTQRELIRGSKITEMSGEVRSGKIEGRVVAIADVIGDWREEIITSTPGQLKIYMSTIESNRRYVTLMQDPIYRIDVAVAFMGYYAPPMLSYDLASKEK